MHTSNIGFSKVNTRTCITLKHHCDYLKSLFEKKIRDYDYVLKYCSARKRVQKDLVVFSNEQKKLRFIE